jgi:aminoglycoside phosphotransferase (APT) family kinase protein
MTRETEFRIIKAAYEAGAMAPEPMWMGDGSLGGEFYVVRRYDGENVPRRLLRDEQYAQARAALPSQLAGVLAKIHAIPPDSIEGVARPAGAPSVAEQALDRHVQLLRAIAPEPHPAFELAFRWLRTRLPDPKSERRTFVHGDFRVGNVLFGPEGLRAMLDWEIAHVGDPMEDLSWVCVRSWRFGGDKPVGGIGTREEFFAAYEAASGVKVDPDVHRWWEIFGNLRWGIICISQAKVYLDGISKSLELAAIGRRTSETEWELMELMDGKT